MVKELQGNMQVCMGSRKSNLDTALARGNAGARSESYKVSTKTHQECQQPPFVFGDAGGNYL